VLLQADNAKTAAIEADLAMDLKPLLAFVDQVAFEKILNMELPYHCINEMTAVRINDVIA
tara:strand:- start:876 stop:1055 length:180 start_codon:yes stop_codon:yes gene_type:complete